MNAGLVRPAGTDKRGQGWTGLHQTDDFKGLKQKVPQIRDWPHPICRLGREGKDCPKRQSANPGAADSARASGNNGRDGNGLLWAWLSKLPSSLSTIGPPHLSFLLSCPY
jgi:hypothetical protein